MFTISFKTERDRDLVFGRCPDYNEEHIKDPYKGISIKAKIGETFMDFISLRGDIAMSNHPYLQIAGEYADGISEDSAFFVKMRNYLDLTIDNPEFLSYSCFMFFLEMVGCSVPAMHQELCRQERHEDDVIEDQIPDTEGMSTFERSMRAFLAYGRNVYDVPFTVYDCETIEDVCIASLHFLITHKLAIRKCKNCGKYFVAYKRSDTEYCDRPSPFNSDKSCKEDGARRTFAVAVGGDELCKEIDRINTNRCMYKYRYLDDEDVGKELQMYKKHLKRWKKEYKSGTKTAEDFMEWLSRHIRYTENWKYEK